MAEIKAPRGVEKKRQTNFFLSNRKIFDKDKGMWHNIEKLKKTIQDIVVNSPI